MLIVLGLCLLGMLLLLLLLQTTGGDRAKLAADVKAADLYAVIAPQMGKQVRLGRAQLEQI
jgi:hypothetical protein